MSIIVLIHGDTEDARFNISNEAELIELINGLDGENQLLAILFSSVGDLMIHASRERRMHIRFCKRDKFDGFAVLVDKTETRNMMLKFHHGNGEIDEFSIRETHSLEDTIRVAIYFFRNQTFPVELNWQGAIGSLPIRSV